MIRHNINLSVKRVEQLLDQVYQGTLCFLERNEPDDSIFADCEIA
jgi:hypothetical protein